MAQGALCERLCVTTTSLSVPPIGPVTRVIDARGYNAARFSLVVLNTDANLTATVQGSNDLENWTDLATLGSSFVLGFAFPAAVTGVAVSYLRLTFILSGEVAFAIVAVNFNLTNL